MKQLQVPLVGLPISLILISYGRVALVKNHQTFPTIFDFDNTVVISVEDIVVNGEAFKYNVALPLTEGLKIWLVSLDLENPFEEYYED